MNAIARPVPVPDLAASVWTHDLGITHQITRRNRVDQRA
jgi:hypothetical protein